MEQSSSLVVRPRLNRTVWWGIIVEAAMVLLAWGLSTWGLFDSGQMLAGINWNWIRNGLVWGAISSLPLLLYLIAFHFLQAAWIESLRKFCFEHLRPLFVSASYFELGLLSVAAGIGEELLFRWCLQGGVSSQLAPTLGLIQAQLLGLLIGSLVFGLCHAVTPYYFWFTFFAGIFFGLTMILFQNWLVPAIAHAIYDFAALVYIVKWFEEPKTSESISTCG